MEILAAKCPNCGGELRLPDDKKQVKCMYCGFDVIVREAVNAAGANVENLLKLASFAEESGNYQEAYDYFTKVLEFEPNNYVALLGKSGAAGYLYTRKNFRSEELRRGIESAIENAPDNKKEEIKNQAAELISNVCSFHKIKTSPEEKPLIDCLEVAHNYSPENVTIISSIISKSQRITEYNQRLISMYKGFIDDNQENIILYKSHNFKSSDIKREGKNLEQNIENLNRATEELKNYESVKNQYIEKLQLLNPEVTSSLVKTLQKSAEENNEDIKSLEDIKGGFRTEVANTGGSGCLIMVIIFVLISLILLLISF